MKDLLNTLIEAELNVSISEQDYKICQCYLKDMFKFFKKRLKVTLKAIKIE